MRLKTILFTQWRRDDEQNAVIKVLWSVIGILVFIILLLSMGWISAPSRLRVYLPPNLDHGNWIKPNDIPKSTIYAFSYQIFTALNTWTHSGTLDYQKNMNAYKNYFSSRFYQRLENDYLDRANTGALNRERILSGVSGMDYDAPLVQYMGNGTWHVDLKLHLIETVDSSLVKDVITDFPLIISRVNESIQVNPWGLIIDGYYQEPTRIKTTI